MGGVPLILEVELFLESGKWVVSHEIDPAVAASPDPKSFDDYESAMQHFMQTVQSECQCEIDDFDPMNL